MAVSGRVRRLLAELPRRKKQIALALAVFAANLLADRLTKLLALRFLAGRGVIRLLGGTVLLVLTGNSGAFLSLGASWPEPLKYLLLLCIPLAFCAVAMIYIFCAEPSWSRIAIIATISGGGMSNLLDRLFNNFQVVDFLNFGIGSLRTGVLNVADLSVTFGALILIVRELIHTPKGAEEGESNGKQG